ATHWVKASAGPAISLKTNSTRNSTLTNHINSPWPTPARALTDHSSSSPPQQSHGYKTVTQFSVKYSTPIPKKSSTNSTPYPPVRRIVPSTTSSSKPSKLLNSKELPHICHPVPRLVPTTIPRRNSRCVRATRTG